MRLIGFWISGDYVSGAASRLPSRLRAVAKPRVKFFADSR